jgi:hypothetical protein
MKSRRFLGNQASSFSSHDIAVGQHSSLNSFLSGVLGSPKGSVDSQPSLDFSPLFDSASKV